MNSWFDIARVALGLGVGGLALYGFIGLVDELSTWK